MDWPGSLYSSCHLRNLFDVPYSDPFGHREPYPLDPPSHAPYRGHFTQPKSFHRTQEALVFLAIKDFALHYRHMKATTNRLIGFIGIIALIVLGLYLNTESKPLFSSQYEYTTLVAKPVEGATSFAEASAPGYDLVLPYTGNAYEGGSLSRTLEDGRTFEIKDGRQKTELHLEEASTSIDWAAVRPDLSEEHLVVEGEADTFAYLLVLNRIAFEHNKKTEALLMNYAEGQFFIRLK